MYKKFKIKLNFEIVWKLHVDFDYDLSSVILDH